MRRDGVVARRAAGADPDLQRRDVLAHRALRGDPALVSAAQRGEFARRADRAVDVGEGPGAAGVDEGLPRRREECRLVRQLARDCPGRKPPKGLLSTLRAHTKRHREKIYCGKR